MNDEEFSHRPAARLLRYVAIVVDLTLFVAVIGAWIANPAGFTPDAVMAGLLVAFGLALLDIPIGADMLGALFNGVRSRFGGGYGTGYGSGYGSGYGGSFGPPATPVTRPPAAPGSAPLPAGPAADDDDPVV